jgi:16S rRNA (guanine966-N2)-methyltransferase
MKSRQQSGKLRIIGGLWRGRKLLVADVEGLRPTADRVRETLFNWLRPLINGSACLDLFAGSGALGFEAASRGAAGVLLLEKNRQVVNILQSQITMVKAENIQVQQADALQWLSQCQQNYDLIFLDPPFDLNLIPQCCELILQHQLLRQNGRLYIESSNADLAGMLPAGLTVLKSSRAGQVYYGLATLADPLELE